MAQVCYEHDVPCIVVRVMSDNADEHANVNFVKFIDTAASYFTRGVIRGLVETL